MKIAHTGWVLAGAIGVGIGVIAEACGGAVEGGGTTEVGPPSPPSTVGSGSSARPPIGPDCAALYDCCDALPAADVSACIDVSSSASNAACAADLSQARAAGYCIGGGGTGTGAGDAGGPEDAGPGDAGGGGDTGTLPPCHKPPPALHPEVTPGVYCPFAGDGGTGVSCSPEQHCCEPPAGNSTCTAEGVACAAASTDWQCGGPVDCLTDAGQLLCCGTGTIDMQAPCGDVPSYSYVSGFKGSTCAASCDTGDMFNGGLIGFVLCSQQSDCPTGTCTPIEPKGGGTGYCAVPSRDAGG